MDRVYDIAVVGGGPSGLHAARVLSQNGLDIIVLEKKKEIGTNIICTGVVGKEVFSSFDLRTDSILGEIREMKIVSSSGNSLTYQHPFAFACIVDRKKFDCALALEAQKAGAEIELETSVSDISILNNHVEVMAHKENQSLKKYSARMIILATGIDSSLNRRLNLGYPKNFLLGAQAEIGVQNGSLPTIFVGKDIAPGAFAWAVPLLSQRIRVGLLAEKNPRIKLQSLLERFYLKKGENFDQNQIQVKAIAQGLVSKTYGEKAIILGEAAGQVKTTTGGGIYFGLHCSQIASEVIIKGYRAGSFHAGLLAEYEKLWKNAIQKEILIGYCARKLFSKLRNEQIEKMFEIVQSDGIIPLIQKKGSFDWQSELISELIKKAPLFRIFNHAQKSKISSAEPLL